VQLLEPCDDSRLGVAIDDGRVVAALPLPDDRLSLVARREGGEGRADIVGDLPAEAEPALVDLAPPHECSSGFRRNPLHSFGKK
jgi:hypothetical protein